MCEPGHDDTAEVQLMDLPDELLVLIFANLDDVEQVLRLRAVCRRWRDVLLDPGVWRRRKLNAYDDGDVRGRRVLAGVLGSRAPCVDKVTFGSNGPLRVYGPLLADPSACAVTRLKCRQLGGGEVRLVTRIVQHQAALGRLREVYIRLYSRLSPPVLAEYRDLLKALCEAEGLTALYLGGNLLPSEVGNDWEETEDLPCLVATKLVKSSLVNFTCLLTLPDGVLEYLLKTHAATLQQVDLDHLRQSPGSPPVATLLSEVRHLCEFGGPILPDMVQLSKCSALKKLDVSLYAGEPVALLLGAEAFMRGATELEEVRLCMLGEEEEAVLSEAADAARLLRALAASKCSKVKTIVFLSIMNFDLTPSLSGLGNVLAWLPQLHTLDISDCSISAAFIFEAITPMSAPSLRWLKVQNPGEGCAHAWMHSDQVVDLLRRNANLHLQFNQGFGTYIVSPLCEQDSACADCERKCHDLRGKVLREIYVTVFAHPRGGSCGEVHGTSWHWCELEV